MIFYDFEVFPQDWLVVIMDTDIQQKHIIVNDKSTLEELYNQNQSNIWVGYNSRNYDQWILKGILCDFNPYEITKHIITDKKHGWQFSNLLNQINLYNYDVMTSMHSLKQLEGFMGHDIRETTIPFSIDRKLTDKELEEVIYYCTHDVEETMEVFMNRLEEFDSQIALLKAFNLSKKYVNKTKAQLSAIILNAHKTKRDDEFDITIPNTLRIKKYQHIVDWYADNKDYKKSLKVDVANVPHVFAWGGIHGAIDNYGGKGIYVNIDVASYYPALMIEYNFLSRNVANPKKYEEIRDTRLKLKKEKNPMQAPYKIVLNSTYGAMKHKWNNLYDPLQANNVCVGGQLLLLDLIEHLDGSCRLIQSNTDGLIVKITDIKELGTIKSICSEWEQRTRMVLDFETFERIYQKDVNNYIIVHEDGSYKSKGGYVKKLNNLDNDLPIVNKAVVDFFIKDIPVHKTIHDSNNLADFQKIAKISYKYLYGMHGDKRLNERVLRVFASRSRSDQGVFKVKTPERIEKIANTPERCFIVNTDVNNVRLPRRLDKKWYIDLAEKRINDFLGISN